MIIDFHTHILPGIDDGSQDLEETRFLLEQEMQQGGGRILATPHFYAGRDTEEHFKKGEGSRVCPRSSGGRCGYYKNKRRDGSGRKPAREAGNS